MLVMAELTPPAEYEIVIEPTHGFLDVGWRELWDYRDLLVLLIQRDFISRYKQTALGPLWFVLQPLLTTLVFVFFSRLGGLPTDGVPRPLFYLAGLLGWNYFSQSITAAGSVYVTNASLFGKVWFPRLIVPLATVLSNLVAFAFQLIPFVLFYVYYVWIAHSAPLVQTDWRLLLIPLPVLQLIVLSLGVSLWMSAATAKYRDLVHLNQYLIQLWLFATPVLYPMSFAHGPLAWVFRLNPVSAPVEALRLCLLGRGALSASDLVISAGLTVVLLGSGLILYRRAERTAIDVV